MTTDSGKAPDEQEEGRKPKERGGAADIDRSKGMGTEEPDSPFGDAEGSGKPKKEA